MKNFEKKIIKACKENDIQKIFTKVWIVLGAATVVGIICKVPKVMYLLVLILMIVNTTFEKAAEKIKLTRDEVFYKNNLFFIVLSDKNVWSAISYVFVLIGTDIIFVGLEFLTESLFLYILVAAVMFFIVSVISNRIARFFENKLK